MNDWSARVFLRILLVPQSSISQNDLHSAHTQSRTTQRASSSPNSRPLWVPSQSFIPDPTSPFSPLLTLKLKAHIFFITVFHLSARPHRTLNAALPRSWNWLSVFALGPVRCNMPNARDKALFLAAVNGPGTPGLFKCLMDEEWTWMYLYIFF